MNGKDVSSAFRNSPFDLFWFASILTEVLTFKAAETQSSRLYGSFYTKYGYARGTQTHCLGFQVGRN